MGYANKNMRLERAFMDGSNRIELVKNRLGIPMGITLDIVNKRIYWSDSHFDTVETVTYHGLDRWGWWPNVHCRNACTTCPGFTFDGCSSPGKSFWKEQPSHLILLESQCLKTMCSSLTGQRWLWWEQTASAITTQRCSIVLQVDRVMLWYLILFSNLLVRTQDTEKKIFKPSLVMLINDLPVLSHSDESLWQTQWWLSTHLYP